MKRLAIILLALLMLVLASTACGLPPCPENYSASAMVEFCVRY